MRLFLNAEETVLVKLDPRLVLTLINSWTSILPAFTECHGYYVLVELETENGAEALTVRKDTILSHKYFLWSTMANNRLLK